MSPTSVINPASYTSVLGSLHDCSQCVTAGDVVIAWDHWVPILFTNCTITAGELDR